VPVASVAEQAQAALGLALEQPQAAAVLAEQARTAARAAGLDVEEAVALRALGLAARSLQEIPAATGFLRRAVEVAARAGDADLEAECRVSLASALLLGGESGPALETLDRASPGPRAAGLVASQRAGILTMLGRFEEALAAYDPLVRSLRRSGDRVLESRVLTNRGLLHVYRGRFHRADADLARAERLAAAAGNLVEAANARHNRGFAAARRGDLPAALAFFDGAERRFAEAGVPLGAGIIDRAEALLAAGLVSDAAALLGRGLAALRGGGDHFGLAEGLLLLADTTHLAGDFDASTAAAGEAVAFFGEQDRPGWQALATAALGRAALGSGAVSARAAVAASEAAGALDRLGLAARALAAHAVAGKLWLAVGAGSGGDGAARARDELTRAASGRRRGPAAGRAVAWDAEAVRRLADGDRRGALAALRAAVAVVDSQQAGLSATELRAHIALHADGSAALGLRLALDSGRPRQILGWMERRRANSLRSWPVRPPPDPLLAQELAELRRLTAEVASIATTGGDPRPIARQAARLERVVRERAWRLGAGGAGADPGPGPAASVVALERLDEVLGEWALVELADSGGELHAVVLAGGRSAHRPLGPTAAVVEELEHLRFALRRRAYGMAGGAAGRRPAAGRAPGRGPAAAGPGRGEPASAVMPSAARLDALLLGPIRALLGDRPVVMVPTGALHATPWTALPTLARRPLTVAPSAHAWRRAVLAPRVDGPLLGVAGPGLLSAVAEVNALRSIDPGAEILTGRAATVAAVLARLNGAGVANIAAHADLNADNGMWSAVQLADGPLTVFELEGLTRAPGLVILSACQSGLATVRPGDELLGLTAALLAVGARTVIASVLPVDDDATAALILAVHARLAAGDGPAVALSRAQRAAADAAVAASFVCFGAP
jgi:tetratricopeptide (TPR) repeat protein